jgi:undecaprenyl-phosphate 4-deoxy-4-formamido-L-arabinose transferase
VDLTRNYGQHNAILCGIRLAKYQLVVTLDDDLQNPPEEIPKLLKKLSEGYDVVYGRPGVEQHNFFRAVASRITKIALSSSMGIESAENVSAFRAFRTELRNAVTSYRGPFVNIDVLLAWATTNFTYIFVQHDARTVGESNYTFRKLLIHALNMITGFSILPLQISSIIGFSITIFGFFILVYVVGRFIIQGGVVPGFSFLASIITIFSGAQLLALGIIGEYLARMHFRMMDKPTYTIRSNIVNDHGKLRREPISITFAQSYCPFMETIHPNLLGTKQSIENAWKIEEDNNHGLHEEDSDHSDLEVA